VEAIVGTACHKVCEHVGCRGIAAVVLLSTAYEEQGLCNMAFAGTGIPRDHKPLLTSYKVQLRIPLRCPRDEAAEAEAPIVPAL
jgi:hypothetical protein